jgi:MFS family permease
MQQNEIKVYGYRWMMLVIFMLIIAINQMMWITFAPITSDASQFYHVSDLKIGMLSMCFMIVFILVSIPASWIIDTYGIRIGVGTGAVLTGVFGLIRGFAGTNYTVLLIAQIGIAVGQPFLLNAITKMAARWFPMNERATASGLGTLSMYIGILSGMVVTPFIVLKYGIPSMLFMVGITSVLIAIFFLLFMKERPPSPSGPGGNEDQLLVLDGFRQTFASRDFRWLMVIFFIGLGAFNAVTTWIENYGGSYYSHTF